MQNHGSDAKNHAGVTEAAAWKASLPHEKKHHANIRKKKAKRRKRHGKEVADGLQDLPLAEGENRARAAASRTVDMKALGNAAPKETYAGFFRVSIGEGIEKNEKKKRNLK